MEVQMAHFKKASGLDMIIAHRLLKNDITADEYILVTGNYLEHVEKRDDDAGLSWTQGNATYSSIGKVDYAFAPVPRPALFV